jgi:hypothetical protein
MPPAPAGHSLTLPSSVHSVCAWCGDAIGTRSLLPTSELNFGICRKCLGDELTRLRARKPAKRSHTTEREAVPALGTVR